MFEGNIGMKRHNGGAGVIRCQRLVHTGTDYNIYGYKNQTSGYFLNERNATEEELDLHGAKD